MHRRRIGTVLALPLPVLVLAASPSQVLYVRAEF